MTSWADGGFLSAAPTAKPKYNKRSARIGVFGALLFNQVIFDGECIEASCVK